MKDLRESYEGWEERGIFKKVFVDNSNSQSELLAIQANLNKGETIKSVLKFRAEEDVKKMEEDLLNWGGIDIFDED